MTPNNRRGDISKDTQSQSGQILFWFLGIVGAALFIFLVIRLMMRVNYKLREVRENFRPTVGWILLAVLIILLLFALFVFILNIVSRRKYKTEESDEQ